MDIRMEKSSNDVAFCDCAGLGNPSLNGLIVMKSLIWASRTLLPPKNYKCPSVTLFFVEGTLFFGAVHAVEKHLQEENLDETRSLF